MPGNLARFFGIRFDVSRNAFNQCVLDAFVNRPAAPFQILFPGRTASFALVLLGQFDQTFGGILMAVEHYVFYCVTQLRRQVVIYRQLTGIDDTHGQTGTNGVVKEYRVNRLADRVVTTERERHVGYTTRHHGVGQVFTNPAGGFNEINSVVVVLLDPGGDREDIGVENDIFRRHAHLVHQ